MTKKTNEVELFIFCIAGQVQWIVLDGKEGLAVARGRDEAKRVQQHYKMSPALVGSVPGETIEAHMEMAKTNGALGVWFLCEGWHWLPFTKDEVQS